MHRSLIFLLLVGLAFLGCKKEQPIYPTPEPGPEPPCDTIFIENVLLDTVFPSDYLMTYPGSWWEYSNGTVDSCIAWEPANLYEWNQNGNCVTITNNIRILSRLENSYGSKVYSFFESFYYVNEIKKEAKKVGQVSEIVDDVFYSSSYTTDPGEYGWTYISNHTTIDHMDSLDVNGQTFYDVLRIYRESKNIYNHLGNGPHYNYEHFYAKNIGLIRKIKLFIYEAPDTADLINYHIEPY